MGYKLEKMTVEQLSQAKAGGRRLDPATTDGYVGLVIFDGYLVGRTPRYDYHTRNDAADSAETLIKEALINRAIIEKAGIRGWFRRKCLRLLRAMS